MRLSFLLRSFCLPLKLDLNRESMRVDLPQPVSPATRTVPLKWPSHEEKLCPFPYPHRECWIQSLCSHICSPTGQGGCQNPHAQWASVPCSHCPGHLERKPTSKLVWYDFVWWATKRFALIVSGATPRFNNSPTPLRLRSETPGHSWRPILTWQQRREDLYKAKRLGFIQQCAHTQILYVGVSILLGGTIISGDKFTEP